MIFRTLLIAALALSSLKAEIINAIAAVVNGEPITLFEIRQAAQEEGVGHDEALEMLIDLRLQEARIKELGLQVRSDQVEQRIAQIAQRNNLDTQTLRQVIESRGIDWGEYREQIEKALLNEMLASRVLSDELVPVSDEEVERHYRQNPEAYARPDSVRVVQYVAQEEALLRQAQQNPMGQHPQVSMQSQTLELDELNPRLAAILTQTPRGEFTPIFSVGENQVTLLVRAHEGLTPRSLEAVRSEIAQELQTRQESRAIESYFARERARAEITILRHP